MKTKKYIILAVGALIIIAALVAFGVYYWTHRNASLQGAIDTSGPYDVNVSVQINITLEDKVKNTDPNIIKAARTALLNYYIGIGKYPHYKFSIKDQVDIFDVIKYGDRSWEVRYRLKNKPELYNNNTFYSSISVEKLATGSYVGSISHSSPRDRGDVTY